MLIISAIFKIGKVMAPHTSKLVRKVNLVCIYIEYLFILLLIIHIVTYELEYEFFVVEKVLGKVTITK